MAIGLCRTPGTSFLLYSNSLYKMFLLYLFGKFSIFINVDQTTQVQNRACYFFLSKNTRDFIRAKLMSKSQMFLDMLSGFFVTSDFSKAFLITVCCSANMYQELKIYVLSSLSTPRAPFPPPPLFLQKYSITINFLLFNKV